MMRRNQRSHFLPGIAIGPRYLSKPFVVSNCVKARTFDLNCIRHQENKFLSFKIDNPSSILSQVEIFSVENQIPTPALIRVASIRLKWNGKDATEKLAVVTAIKFSPSVLLIRSLTEEVTFE
jgi:hypothetical protein